MKQDLMLLMTLVKFQKEERGSMTALSLLLLIVVLFFSGLAIDTTNATRAHAQLQNAADSAAHAAVVWLEENSESSARLKAIEAAERVLPPATFGTVLQPADVEFGTWNKSTGTWQDSGGEYPAIRVTTRLNESNNNGLRTFFMSMVGFDFYDINTDSIWISQNGLCDGKPGFFAVGVVDVQSNNGYADEFCMHSQSRVEVNNNNEWELGTTVSMPNEADMVYPDLITDHVGLSDALTSDDINIERLIADLPAIIQDFSDPLSTHNDGILTSASVNVVPELTPNAKLTMADLVEGAVNTVTCKNGTMTVDNNVTLVNVVIVTDCDVKFNSGSAVENSTLITTSTSSKSFSASSGLRLGSTSFCTDGNGKTNLITMGGFEVASALEAYGANVTAAGSITISANANALAGSTFIAGGRIDNTSNNSYGFCSKGNTGQWRVAEYRMVR